MRRLSHIEFVKKVNEIHFNNILVVGQYKTFRDRIKLKCIQCLCEWEPLAATPLHGSGCPECGKKKAASVPKHPNAACKFYEKLAKKHSNTIQILTTYLGSDKEIFARCTACSHSWKSTPDRLIKHRCYVCERKSKGLKARTNNQAFCQKLFETHAGKIVALEEYTTGKSKILVRCACGHEWRVRARNLTRRGCPRCPSSKAEMAIEKMLLQNNIKFIREYKIKELGNLRFDFAIFDNGKLERLIEYDGYHHFFPHPKFGGEKRLEKQRFNDQKKNDFCAKNNIPLVRLKGRVEDIRLQDLLQ